MRRFLLRRLLLALPTLLGITLLTFVLLNLTPGALLGSLQDPQGGQTLEQAHRRAELELGMRDPVTGELRPLLARYAEWLARAARLELAAPGQSSELLRAKIAHALPRTLLVNALALTLALVIGVRLGARLGMRAGSSADRVASLALTGLAALPEFLVGTLLVLVCGGALGWSLLPVVGLQSEAAPGWPAWRKALDLLAHLVLPVATLGVPLGAFFARFVRDAVARALVSEPLRAQIGLGAGADEQRAAALRHALVALATLAGGVVPTCVAGSVVVEQVFAIDGMGTLARQAFADRDQPLVMALTLLVAVATLGGLLLSDLLQAWLDPRVELAAEAGA